MRRFVGVAVAAGLVVAACGDGGAQRSADLSSADVEDLSFDEIHVAAEHMEVFGTELAGAIGEAVDLSGAVHAKASELRAQLDFLLREHEVLLASTTRAVIADQPEVASAAEHELSSNTDALRRKVAELATVRAADEFEEHWTALTGAMINFAQGVGADDGQAQREAHEDAERALDDLVDWAEDVTAGAVAVQELQRALDSHLLKTEDLIEAQADGTADWYAALREAVEQIAEVATLLAAGFATDARLEGDVRSEAAEILVQLAGAMEDNASFTALLTRAQIAGREADVRSAEAIVQESTAAIAEVLGRTLGDEVRREFGDLWSRHIDLFRDYVDATAAGDATSAEEVRDELAAWAEELGAFLERATRGKMKATTGEQEAAEHNATIIDVIDAQVSVLRD